MEGWKGGRVEEWKGGRVEGWKDGRMELSEPGFIQSRRDDMFIEKYEDKTSSVP